MIKILILIAFVLFSGCIGETDIIRGGDGVFEIEVNNTNLAPSVAGETPGTGERITNVTYYANETPIQIFVYGHANTTGSNSELHLLINGTKVADSSGRPLGVAEQNNKTIIAIIPKYASYLIEGNNLHHYEWREYRVIAGTNGSVSLTTNYYNTTGGSGVSDLANLTINTNKSWLNYSITNLSGLNMTGDINMSRNNISSIFNLDMNGTQNLSYTGNISNANKITIINYNDNITSSTFNVSDLYFVSTQSAFALYSFDAVNTLTTYRLARNTTIGNYTYLTPNTLIFNFAVGGYNTTPTTTNVTTTVSRARFDIRAGSAGWNETSQPTRIEFSTNNGSSLNIATTISHTNNLEINRPGKGIQLTSPDGLQTACITLSNAGVLTTTAGVCT